MVDEIKGNSARLPWVAGLMVIGVALLISMLLVLFGLTTRANYWISDLAGMSLPGGSIAQSPILLVNRNPGNEATSSLALLERLREQGARKIAFMYLPEDEDGRFVALALAGEEVVLGRPIKPLPDGSISLMPVPERLQALPVGVLGLADFLGLPARQQLSFYEVNGQKYQSLEAMLAGVGQETTIELNPYRISQFLPQVEAEQIVAGQVAENLVRDRIVLIANRFPPEHATFDHLEISAFRSLTMAEYHGYVLEVLLLDLGVGQSSTALTIFLLILFALGTGIYFQRAPARVIIRMTLFGYLALALLFWLVLFLFHFRLPLVDLAILLTNLFFFMIFRKYSMLTTSLHREILDASGFMERRYMPAGFFTSDQHWAQIANMVKQMLQLRRTIFLDRVAGDHRVREVIALECKINDISEMRRDYQRTPYTTALDANGPIRLNRPYLATETEDEVQYLVPLSFGGEVVGFWALGISQEMLTNEAEFEASLGYLAIEIGEMLSSRNRYLGASHKMGILPSLFSFNFDEEMGRLLHKSTALLERHLARLENVLQGANTSFVLYDLFGQVLMINESMVETLRQIDFKPYDNTLADLIMKLTECDEIKAKRTIQLILEADRKLYFPLNLMDGKRTAFMQLRSLASSNLEFEATPFRKLGILCEMADITHMRRLYEMKEQIIGNTTMQMRNDMMAISLAGNFLGNRDISPEQRDMFLETIKDKLADLEGKLMESNRYLEEFTFKFGAPVFPMPFTASYSDARLEIDGLREEKRITIEDDIPKLLNLVMASPGTLRELIAALFRILIEDAERGSTLKVWVNEDPGLLQVRMANRGFGIPDEQLQKQFQGQEESDIASFQDLRKAMSELHDWGGSLKLSSAVGQGLEASLTLATFLTLHSRKDLSPRT